MTVKDLLSRYAAGEYDVFKSLTSTQFSILSTKMLAVPTLGIGGERARRVRAAFGLEFARSATADQWHQAIRVFELVREQLIMRPLAQDAFNRHWHEVLIATLEMSGDSDTLDRELRSALREFPGEPRFVLARGVSAELRLQSEVARGLRPADLGERAWSRVRSLLADALTLPEVHGEAALRLGHVELELQRYPSALARFDEAKPLLNEQSLRYLVDLFRGDALTGLGQRVEAEAAYRAALGLQPGAQSATVKLAGLLFIERRLDEADVMADHLIRSPANWDPWWIYRKGDQRLLNQALSELRADCQ